MGHEIEVQVSFWPWPPKYNVTSGAGASIPGAGQDEDVDGVILAVGGSQAAAYVAEAKAMECLHTIRFLCCTTVLKRVHSGRSMQCSAILSISNVSKGMTASY